MASFSGTFQLTGGRGAQSGPCALSFDKDTLQLVSGGAPVLACDLGDIDVFAPGDCILDLTFFTGQQLRLQQFGKAFDNLVHDLLEAYRARLVKCLLLDDLEEVSRFTGTVEYRSPARSFSGPSEIRLYQSNFAVLPLDATGFQWRLVDIDAVQFDAGAYASVLRSRDEMVKVTKLAKRTDEFRQRVEAAIRQVGERSAKVLHWFFFRIAPPAAKEPVLAWEATSRQGRATYVFRESALVAGGGASVSPDAAADRLARGLALVNFRREPVYLPDDSLQVQPKFRRYAIASRRLPELADLRRAFAGRAIHTSLDAWQKQMDDLMKSD